MDVHRMTATVFSPAKLNLFLAVTGRRADGFHELVSLVAPLEFGDKLEAEVRDQRTEVSGQRTEDGGQKTGDGGPFTLECDDPAVPTDESNLVLRAAEAFRAASGWSAAVHFRLTKRIPMGAGLGGGSSNAVAALRALNTLAGDVLPEARLVELAAELGSDCALFLQNAPVVMRGRGERVELLPAAAVARLRGRRVLLFKPSFAVSTVWAYQKMAAAGGWYLPAAEAEARLAAWTGSNAPAEDVLFNNMEGVAFAKFLALPVLVERLRRDSGVAVGMSGSGSACFALLPPGGEAAPLARIVRECWGPAALVEETHLR
jgi:4-diphosphocytidyl-2-C-methyl-D-erythritol kinase